MRGQQAAYSAGQAAHREQEALRQAAGFSQGLQAALSRIPIHRELFRRDELEKMVRSMIRQYVSTVGQVHPPDVQPQRPPAVPQQTVDAAVSMMLDNLDEFL